MTKDLLTMKKILKLNVGRIAVDTLFVKHFAKILIRNKNSIINF